ncbi:peptidoglycan editing factor PgeF [Crenobacter cavernae]|uniref:Purine nucleoside phosphorylase n=1 Tax=Crenobacter cavernae TaxID=2290923 RepID=A0A345YAD7_9NEIS|nr:peptidoglycan editing factor PgeF [Crenobacter cavernae]AXK40889.1 peptidoglycan editing factor PgeF [Crenobacter cavernae]
MSKFITSANGTPAQDDGALGFTPCWPAPANVGALISTRKGGVSAAPYDSLNLGQHVGDDPAAVAENRRRLALALPHEPVWLNQVHGVVVVDADKVGRAVPDADASVSRTPGIVCAIMTADCLPVLLADVDGTVVGAAHAGWRGLVGGVIEATVSAMAVPGDRLAAYLGPAISPDAFEVGGEVRDAFLAHDAAADAAFSAIDDGKYLADIYALARLRLAALGVTQVSGGDACTVIDRDRFFSYRRDKTTGRMASCIWLKP